METNEGSPDAYEPEDRPGRRMSRLAFWSFALGLLFFIPPIGAIAFFLGLAARDRILQSNGELTGLAEAKAGIWLGLPSLLIMCFLCATIPALEPGSGGSRRRVSCRSNLKQIGLAVGMYQADYEEAMPPSLTILVKERYLKIGRIAGMVDGRRSVLQCPTIEEKRFFDSRDADATCDYFYFPLKSPPAATATTPIAWDKSDVHGGLGVNALFYDLHVSFIATPALKAAILANRGSYTRTPLMPRPLPPARSGVPWRLLIALAALLAAALLAVPLRRIVIRAILRRRARRLDWLW